SLVPNNTLDISALVRLGHSDSHEILSMQSIGVGILAQESVARVTSSIKNTRKGFKDNEKERKGKSLNCDDQYESFSSIRIEKGFLQGDL
nr:hypothetical protein [Tanacetum cinerariifolium]